MLESDADLRVRVRRSYPRLSPADSLTLELSERGDLDKLARTTYGILRLGSEDVPREPFTVHASDAAPLCIGDQVETLARSVRIIEGETFITEAGAPDPAVMASGLCDDEVGPKAERDDFVPQRRYLPTLAELIDRMSIVLQKAIFIKENHDAYMAELADIEHDIDIAMIEQFDTSEGLRGKFVRAVLVIMLSNRFIWENESAARKGNIDEAHNRLAATHSINGVRAAAKNVIAAACGERVDLKADCFAAELVETLGNWNVL